MNYVAYTSTDLSQLTGLTARQLEYADRIGLLTPSIAATSGKGRWRAYSQADAVAARALALLGIGTPGLREALTTVRSHYPADLDGMYLIVAPGWLTIVDHPTACRIVAAQLDRMELIRVVPLDQCLTGLDGTRRRMTVAS